MDTNIIAALLAGAFGLLGVIVILLVKASGQLGEMRDRRATMTTAIEQLQSQSASSVAELRRDNGNSIRELRSDNTNSIRELRTEMSLLAREKTVDDAKASLKTDLSEVKTGNARIMEAIESLRTEVRALGKRVDDVEKLAKGKATALD